jgi:hypothetical protein
MWMNDHWSMIKFIVCVYGKMNNNIMHCDKMYICTLSIHRISHLYKCDKKHGGVLQWDNLLTMWLISFSWNIYLSRDNHLFSWCNWSLQYFYAQYTILLIQLSIISAPIYFIHALIWIKYISILSQFNLYGSLFHS